MATNFQARQVWKKFCSWYGADVIERKYGVQVPEDWCEVIDDIPQANFDGVMADVRMKHPTWPPGLPEFEQIVRAATRVRDESPTVQEQLCDFVLRNKPLTANQLRLPWTYIGQGNARTGENFIVTGVVIPADGNAPSYRVMLVDIDMGAAA